MTDLKKLMKRVGERVSPTFQKMRPYITVADRVAGLAVHLRQRRTRRTRSGSELL